jgi:ribosomal protein L32
MTLSPKKKTSKSRTKRRTTNWIKLTAKKITNKVALNKEWTWLAHMVDKTWTYNGRKILSTKKKWKTTRV